MRRGQYNEAVPDIRGNPLGYSKNKQTLCRFVLNVSRWIHFRPLSLILFIFPYSAGGTIFEMGSSHAHLL